MELNAAGTDYEVLQTDVEATLGEGWTAVLHVLEAAYTRLTRQEILKEWPEDYPRPESTTLWRWLSRAVAVGTVQQCGTGRPRDPFRYWLASREPLLRPDWGTEEELEAWNLRWLEDCLQRTGEKNRVGAAAVDGEGDTRPPAGSDQEEGQAEAAASATPPEPPVVLAGPPK